MRHKNKERKINEIEKYFFAQGSWYLDKRLEDLKEIQKKKELRETISKTIVKAIRQFK